MKDNEPQNFYAQNNVDLNSASRLLRTSSNQFANLEKTVKAYEVLDIPINNETNSNESLYEFVFDEIFIAPISNQNDKYFSVKANGTNLVFTRHKSNDFLKENSNLTNNAPNADNHQEFVRSNMIQLTTINSAEYTQPSDSDVSLTPVVDSLKRKFIKFNSASSSKSYFSSESESVTIDASTKNVLLRFYLNSSLTTDERLCVFFKSGNTIIGPSSSSSDRQKVNYYTRDAISSIEGIIGLNPKTNKLVWSFDENVLQNSTSIKVNYDNEKIKKFLMQRASTAFNTIINYSTDKNADSWNNILKLIAFALTTTQFYLSKVNIAANDSDGTIRIHYYLPYVIERKKIYEGFHSIKVNSKSSSNLTLISGFNSGSTLNKNTFDASSLGVIPQKALATQTILNKIYQTIFDEGFGPDNLLSDFNPTTDMQLDDVVFDNLKGTIEATLTIKKNYINSDGTQITQETPKSFGKITINNFQTIQATQQKANSINISNDSPLKEMFPFSARDNIEAVKNEIFSQINTIVNSLPNINNAVKEFTISNINLQPSAITNIGKSSITLNGVAIDYYFNSKNGSYENQEPFLINNLTINGFKPANSTTINTSGDHVLDTDVSTIYPQTYLDQNIVQFNEFFLNYIFTNTNEGKLIIENAPKKGEVDGFKTSNIKILKTNFNNLEGTLSVDFTIDKWMNETGEIMSTDYPVQTIVFKGFKKIQKTTINSNKTYEIEGMSGITPLDFIKSNYELTLKNFIFQNAFNDQSQQLITGTKPSEEFSINNISIAEQPIYDNKKGTISFKFKLNHYVDDKGAIIKTNKHKEYLISPPITLGGFKSIKPTTFITTTFNVENMLDVEASKYTIEQAQAFIVEKQNNNQLLDPVANDFNPANDLRILPDTWKIDNQNGTIKFQIEVRNAYDINANLIQSFKPFGLVTLTGFKQIIQTKLLNPTVHQVDPSFESIDVDNVSVEQIKTILIDLFNKRKLINAWPASFNPNTDIDVKTEYISSNPEKGIIFVDVHLKNVYDAQLNPTPDFNNLGRIQLNGFRPRISTSIIEGTYNLKDLSYHYHELYATDITTNEGSIGNINNIIKQFVLKGSLLTNLPKDFDYKTNIVNIVLKTSVDGLSVDVSFSINNYLINGDKNQPQDVLSGSIKLIGFIALPATSINGSAIDFNNVSNIMINCIPNQKILEVVDIAKKLIEDKTLITHSSPKEWWSPLLSIKQPDLKNSQTPFTELVFDVSNGVVTYDEEADTITISNVRITGSYCYYNSNWTKITKTTPYSITIRGFGQLQENKIPLVTIISVSIASVVFAIILFFIGKAIYKKLAKKRRKSDKYEDTTSSSVSF